MEFWVGLSVGMHLGKVIADYLEKFIETTGLLSETTLNGVREIEEAEAGIISVIEEESAND
jgi:hypothetical protein